MDPDETLKEIRRLIAKAGSLADADSNDAEIEVWQEVGSLVEDLDGWLSKGGFPPAAWMAKP